MDREKVIRDLRYLKSFGRVSNISYITEIAENAIALLKEDCHNCKLECLLHKYDELKEKYDALLKEQEAVEPEVDYICGNIVNVCGKCRSNLIARVKFCPWCGRAVKWD